MDEKNSKKDYLNLMVTAGIIVVILGVAVVLFCGYVDSRLNSMEQAIIAKSTIKGTDVAIKEAHNLFNQQFSNLLTVFAVLIGTFGLLVPFLSYFFQRQSLKEERTRIERETQEKIADAVEEAKQDIKDEDIKVAIEDARKNIKNEDIVDAIEDAKKTIKNETRKDITNAVDKTRRELIEQQNTIEKVKNDSQNLANSLYEFYKLNMLNYLDVLITTTSTLFSENDDLRKNLPTLSTNVCKEFDIFLKRVVITDVLSEVNKYLVENLSNRLLAYINSKNIFERDQYNIRSKSYRYARLLQLMMFYNYLFNKLKKIECKISVGSVTLELISLLERKLKEMKQDYIENIEDVVKHDCEQSKFQSDSITNELLNEIKSLKLCLWADKEDYQYFGIDFYIEI